jgi:hypothetical protein
MRTSKEKHGFLLLRFSSDLSTRGSERKCNLTAVYTIGIAAVGGVAFAGDARLVNHPYISATTEAGTNI